MCAALGAPHSLMATMLATDESEVRNLAALKSAQGLLPLHYFARHSSNIPTVKERVRKGVEGEGQGEVGEVGRRAGAVSSSKQRKQHRGEREEGGVECGVECGAEWGGEERRGEKRRGEESKLVKGENRPCFCVERGRARQRSNSKRLTASKLTRHSTPRFFHPFPPPPLPRTRQSSTRKYSFSCRTSTVIWGFIPDSLPEVFSGTRVGGTYGFSGSGFATPPVSTSSGGSANPRFFLGPSWAFFIQSKSHIVQPLRQQNWLGGRKGGPTKTISSGLIYISFTDQSTSLKKGRTA